MMFDKILIIKKGAGVATVLRITEKSKIRKSKKKDVSSLAEYGVLDIDIKATLINELIPLGLLHVNELLQEEVRRLGDERYGLDGLVGPDR